MLKFVCASIIMLSLGTCFAADVTVTGTGQVKAEPDEAVIVFTVDTQSTKMASAIDGSTKQIQEVLSKFDKDFKIDRKNIKTAQFTVEPQWAPQKKDSEELPKIIGYIASHRITVTLSDIKQTGKVVGAVTKTNGRLNAVYFIPSDVLRKKLLSEARKEAMKDAQEKAKLYAESAKAKMGKVKNISESFEETPYAQNYGQSAVHSLNTAPGSEIPIQPGEINLSVKVRVVYNLDDL